MKKRFAPLAVLFGLLGALLLGGASVANAGDDGFKCKQTQSGVTVNVVNVSCVLNNSLNNININVSNIRVLTLEEVHILENSLNNTNVNIEALEQATINTLNNFGGINVSDINVKVCTGVLYVKQCT